MMFSCKSVLSAVSAILVVSTAAISANAWVNPSRMTKLTFNQSVALPGVTLGAGTYVFELAAPGYRTDIVRVMNSKRNIVFYTGFTEEIERPAGQPANRLITLGEAPIGAAAPIIAWFPVGDSVGHRFLYSQR